LKKRKTRLGPNPDNRWLLTGIKDLLDLLVQPLGDFADELYFPGEKYRNAFPDLPGQNEKSTI
jgi:hypothetical protein